MMEITITESRCSHCGQTKAAKCFHKNKSSPNGLNYWCKDCVKTRNDDPERKKRRKAYRQQPNVKAKDRENANKRLKTPEGQRKTKIYNSSENHKIITRRYMSEAFKDPLKKQRLQATNAVADAVRKGKMKPARDLDCAKCGNPAKEYHHHLGYEKEKRLAVIPLCRECHAEIHRFENG